MQEATERICVSGLDPDKLATVPAEASFLHDFMEAPDLEEIGEALIRHRPRVSEAESARIRYMWQQRHSMSSGLAVFGKCQKLSGAAKIAARCDYIIHCAADLVRETEMTNHQLEALVYHELRHVKVETTDDGERVFKIRGHDLEMFRSDVEDYGLWMPSFERAAETFQQLSLIGPDGHSNGAKDSNGVSTVTLSTKKQSVTLTSKDLRNITDRLTGDLTGQLLRNQIELDPDVTPMASGLIPDPAPEFVVAETLRASGIPVTYDAEDGLYRNPNGDAYADGWAPQEAAILQARAGFTLG